MQLQGHRETAKRVECHDRRLARAQLLEAANIAGGDKPAQMPFDSIQLRKRSGRGLTGVPGILVHEREAEPCGHRLVLQGLPLRK
jgi:hypothetical protein